MTTTARLPHPGSNNAVDHPQHYNMHPSGIECIEVIRHMSFNLGCVVKYVWRDGLKDAVPPIEDLEKAAWYLNDEIEKRRAAEHKTDDEEGAT